jgi:hypothetical protein
MLRFTTGNNGFLDYVGIAGSSGSADVSGKADVSYVDAQDASALANAKTYSDTLITQIIDGAPNDANTLKELNDKIIAVQAIIGSGDADADTIVNTVKELLAVFATFPEGVDLVTLLAAKVNKTDVYNALDSIVAGKVLDSRQGKVLNDLIVALQSGKQNTLVSGTNIKTINGASVLGSGDIPVSAAAGGDMMLADVQTNSGLKTFLSGTFGLRNLANTFTSFFINSNTANRTYTLQNRNGTLADMADVNAKMNTPSGTVNFLSKFLTPTTIGLSRLFDNGTFFGIGTVNTPAKDITLGNQSNREIGVELSDSITIGRGLIIKAGDTINYILNSNFNALNQTSRVWRNSIVAPNGNVYACVWGGDIYMQTAGTGAFAALGQTSRNWHGISAYSNNNIYATIESGDIYMQTAGTGAFAALGQTSRNWRGITVAPNGNVYACVSGGDIYMQTAGTGVFAALGQASRNWHNMASAPNGDIYAYVRDNGGLYKQTGGTGTFLIVSGAPISTWGAITVTPNGNVYLGIYNGSIFLQINGSGTFNNINQTGRIWFGMSATTNGDVYCTVESGDIYKQLNDAVGTADLQGGNLQLKAGTGKGTGQSRLEIITGQKTVSGTDMQLETVRATYDEDGNYTRIGTPIFADNASAIAGGLLVGMEYRTSTGIKMEVF